uniref:G-protein coupled receptors family 1 profile domain-containing protein n=1 Tax=Lates calcarifer TaxID=8187 RepID=A0A4W6CV58_LATCA
MGPGFTLETALQQRNWGSAQEGREPSWSRMDASFLSDIDYNHSYVDEHFYFEDNIDGFGITMAILYLVVCILGLAGNSLVIVAILKLDKMSSSTTVYIFNLALADGLFMVGLPFIASQNFQNHWMFGDMACKVVMVLDGINQFTSVFCLTVMSIDRYMAVADPLRFARWRTPRCAKISLVIPVGVLPPHHSPHGASLLSQSRPMYTRFCLECLVAWRPLLHLCHGVCFAIHADDCILRCAAAYPAVPATPDPNTEPREPPAGAAGHQDGRGGGGCVWHVLAAVLHLQLLLLVSKWSGPHFRQSF